MNKKLEETLDLCLADIKAGRATLDQCLSRYAEQMPDLEFLLRASISLQKMPLPLPSEKHVQASRQRVLQEFRAPAPALWWQIWKHTFTPRTLFFSAVFSFFLMAILSAGAFLAASNRGSLLANAYPNPEAYPSQPQVPPTAEPLIVVNSIGLSNKFAGSQELASAPDGTLWFVHTDTGQVGSVDPNDRKRKNWPIVPNAGHATGIAVDSAGMVWLTMSSSQSVIALNPTSNQISSWRVPLAAAGPLGRISAGTDGRIWLIAGNGSYIYSLEPETGEFTPYEVSGAQYLEWANDALWFSGESGKLGKITAEGQIQSFDVPGHPAAILWDGESLWYAGGALIGQFDSASGRVNPFALESMTTDRIATDGLGNIWFGSRGGTELGVLELQSGKISTRSLDSFIKDLYSLAVGTDKIWISDNNSTFIYAFSLSASGELTLQTDRFMAAFLQGRQDGVAGIP